MGANICRFLSFESFVDLVVRKELAFVTYDMWDDPYEGFVLRAIRTNKGRSDIIKWLQATDRTSINPEVRLRLLEIYSKSVHLQSWTLRPESDALWRIYAHSGHAIRISTTISKLQIIEGVSGFPVEYFPSIPLEKELKRIFGRDVTRFEALFTCKRNAFEHEKEFRIITAIDNSLVSSSQVLNVLRGALDSGQKLPEQTDNGNIDNAFSQKTNIRNIKYISFSHIPDFIESVMVHPTAPDWFVETTRRYCEINSINFQGKSRLYTFEY